MNTSAIEPPAVFTWNERDLFYRVVSHTARLAEKRIDVRKGDGSKCSWTYAYLPQKRAWATRGAA